MKFTSIKINKQNKLQVGVHDAEWFMQRITHETNDFFTTGFREHLKTPTRWHGYRYINEIPRLCVAGEFRRTPTNDLVLVRFNGLIVLEVRELTGEDACETLKQRAMMSPSTWAAFIGASRLSGPSREGQLAPQLEQSWVHSSIVVKRSLK